MSQFKQDILAKLSLVPPQELRERVASVLEAYHEDNLEWPERLGHPELQVNPTLRLMVKNAAVESMEGEGYLRGYLLEGRK